MLGSFSIMYKVGKEQYQEKLKVLKLVHLYVSDRVVQAGRKGLVMTWEVMTGVSHDGLPGPTGVGAISRIYRDNCWSGRW